MNQKVQKVTSFVDKNTTLKNTKDISMQFRTIQSSIHIPKKKNFQQYIFKKVSLILKYPQKIREIARFRLVVYFIQVLK